jgi:hypothetical protein
VDRESQLGAKAGSHRLLGSHAMKPSIELCLLFHHWWVHWTLFTFRVVGPGVGVGAVSLRIVKMCLERFFECSVLEFVFILFRKTNRCDHHDFGALGLSLPIVLR